MGLRILHSADWHLDTPFLGFTPDQRAYLKEELLKIPGKVADICRKLECDLVLLSGDIFDGPYSKESAAVLREALRRCGVPVFISPGNHDFCGPGSPWLEERWPENVKVFTGDLESVVIPELSCRVYGAGYRSMDCPGLMEGFRAEGEETWCVGVLHGDPVRQNSPYCPVTAGQVRDSGLDYLALGHIHKAGSFVSGGTSCVWPGSPMGRGWDETGEKGVVITELEQGAAPRFLPLDTPCFHEFTVDADGDGKQALEAQLPAAGSRDFYRITLTGTGAGDLGEIAEKFPNLTILDHREAAVDLWSAVGEDTLEGTYFVLLKEQLENADDQTAEVIRLAAELSRKLLDGREVAL